MRDSKGLGIKPKMVVSHDEHWEVKYKHLEGNNENPEKSFLPMPGNKRAQPHQKVNESDH
jgi:hypothetical protein